jgi:hypothetical protein
MVQSFTSTQRFSKKQLQREFRMNAFLSQVAKKEGWMFFMLILTSSPAEILVGFPAGSERFSAVLTDAVVKTDNLVERFVIESEALISQQLTRLIFQSRTVPVAGASETHLDD